MSKVDGWRLIGCGAFAACLLTAAAAAGEEAVPAPRPCLSINWPT